MISPKTCSSRRAGWRCRAITVVLALAAGACSDPALLVNDRVGLPAARSGSVGADIDGLTVGHRLMDAGEFELALKAYTRAATQVGLNMDVLSAIGSANLRLGRLGQAERVLRAALDKDETFVPALNNLGVVLNGRGKFGEAREMFRVAYALDNGNSDEIRDNLRLLDTKIENIAVDQPDLNDFRLVRRGNGQYLLLGQ